jgi:arylformamidase
MRVTWVAAARTAILLTVVLALAACTNDASSSTDACPARTDQTDIPYVDDPDPLQRLDLHVPAGAGCAPSPLVVWVHGGGWQIGDKRNSMDRKVELWTGAGWAVASLNYRLTDTAVPVTEQVLAPDHNEDVAAALAWLIDNASELGIDPDHIALVGHSAGAGITAAIATDPAYLGAHDLDPSAVACAAPLDTEGFDVPAAIGGGGQQAQLYQTVFGTDPARWVELSPITHIGEAPVPDLFLVTRGTPTRRGLTQSFADAVDGSGGDVTIVDLPTFSHEDVNRRIGDPADSQLTPALQRFLNACLAPAGTG